MPLDTETSTEDRTAASWRNARVVPTGTKIDVPATGFEPAVSNRSKFCLVVED